MSETSPDSLAQLSPGEEAFERWRKRVGLGVAPAVGLGLWLLPVTGLTPAGHALLAILGLVVVLWLTEALPMAATALLGPTLGVVFGVASAKDMFKPFADPIIFLFIGSFMLVEAMMKHGLNRRLAFLILGARAVGESPLRLYFAFGLIVTFLSMWVSNTASATMVVPVAIAIAQAAGVDPLKPALAACLGASMGFLLPVSTGPNAIVYGSGCVPLRQMVRHGAILDVVGFGVIVAAVNLLG